MEVLGPLDLPRGRLLRGNTDAGRPEPTLEEREDSGGGNEHEGGVVKGRARSLRGDVERPP